MSDRDTATPRKKAAPRKRRQGQRPPDDSWKAKFLESFRLLGVVQPACQAAGISRATAYRHRESDPVFAAAWDQAEADATDVLERVAHTWATTGVPVRTTATVTRTDPDGATTTTVTVTEAAHRSPFLLGLLLKARAPHRFRERYEVTTPPVTPVGYDFSKLSDEELEIVYDGLAKAAVERVTDGSEAEAPSG